MPPLLLVTVTLATFGLAKWHPFSPSAAPAASAAGDATHGREVFVVNCSGCHGMDATGGIGPSLHGTGLGTPDQLRAALASVPQLAHMTIEINPA